MNSALQAIQDNEVPSFAEVCSSLVTSLSEPCENLKAAKRVLGALLSLHVRNILGVPFQGWPLAHLRFHKRSRQGLQKTGARGVLLCWKSSSFRQREVHAAQLVSHDLQVALEDERTVKLEAHSSQWCCQGPASLVAASSAPCSLLETCGLCCYCCAF